MIRLSMYRFRMVFSRALFTAFTGVVLLTGGCSSGKNDDKGKGQVPTLPVMKVIQGAARIPSEYSARLEGRTDVEIRPQLDGILNQIFVREGDFVQQGQPLFLIDDAVYQERYRTALAAQHAAEAQAAVAQVEADRLVPLVENKVISPVQLKTTRAQARAAKATAEQAEAVARSARITLGYTLIKAPVSGYIGRIPFRQGTLLTENQATPLTTLSDISQIYAVFSIGESEFQRFKSLYKGATIQEKLASVPPVKLRLSDGSTYIHEGKLESLSGEFDRATGSIGLRARFPNEEGLLRSGNSGTVTLEASFDGIILVPQSATVELQDKVFVFVVQKGNTVRKQVISVAGRSGDHFIVMAGVRPGELIVTAGVDKLQDGAVIKPIRNASQAAAPVRAPSAAPDH